MPPPAHPHPPLLTSNTDVLHHWAMVPGEGVIEGVAQIEEAPGDDDTVTQAHQDAYLRANMVGRRGGEGGDTGPWG